MRNAFIGCLSGISVNMFEVREAPVKGAEKLWSLNFALCKIVSILLAFIIRWYLACGTETKHSYSVREII